MSILLGATAAATCPVKTQNAFSPGLEMCGHPPDHVANPHADRSVDARLESRRAHRHMILDRWLSSVPDALDLRPFDHEPVDVRASACREALEAGRPLIVGGTLPADLLGHRVGTPDALLRGLDQGGGRPGYHPVVVKWHRIIAQVRPTDAGQNDEPPPRLPSRLHWGTLAAPDPRTHPPLLGYSVRLGYRKRDFLQVAHYVRMLAASGFGSGGRPWGGVIGTDEVPEDIPEEARPVDGVVIAWADLAEPTIRASSPTDPRGWELRSVLARYDEEHCFRLAIAEAARRQSGDPDVDPPDLVSPIVNPECGGCPWWNSCRARLPDDDLSLRIERGPLDAREIITLRRAGISTVPQLAAADLDHVLPIFLPEVSHRAGAENRLRTAARRAGMLMAGVSFERETAGPIDVPAAELEVDFDLETASDGRIYLWGFRVQAGSAPPYSRQFCRFADLGEAEEAELAREALAWLRDLVEGPRSVRVFHYSGFEVAMLEALANRTEDPLLRWGTDYAKAEFVDLLEIIKTHYFGVSGLGLKSIAQYAGFRWRDADPGGLNSQIWFAEAVHGNDGRRRGARRRVLEYNEDDVSATGWLRAWLRAQ